MSCTVPGAHLTVLIVLLSILLDFGLAGMNPMYMVNHGVSKTRVRVRPRVRVRVTIRIQKVS